MRWTLRIFAPCGIGPLRQRRTRPAEGGEPLLERAHLALGQIGRELEQVPVELAQAHVTLAGADGDVVDGRVSGDAGDLLLLLRDQAVHPVRRALTDEDDPGTTDQAVHRVERGGARHTGRHPPVALELLLEQPTGGAGLALGLGEHRGLRPSAEHQHRRDEQREHREGDADIDRIGDPEQQQIDDRRGQDAEPDRVRQEFRVLLTRQGERLAHAAPRVAALGFLGDPHLFFLCARGLCGLARSGRFRHVVQDRWAV